MELNSFTRIWSFIVGIALMASVYAGYSGTLPPIETDLRALLPRSSSQIIEESSARQLELQGRHVVFLIEQPDLAIALHHARQLQDTIAATNLIRFPKAFTAEETVLNLVKFYEDHAGKLLSTKDRALFSLDNPVPALIEELQRQLLSPMGGMLARLLPKDPLLLNIRFLIESIPMPIVDNPGNGFPLYAHEGGRRIAIRGELLGSPFDEKLQNDLSLALAKVAGSEHFLQHRTVIRTGGMLWLAHAGRVRAMKEVTLLGVGSTLAVLCIILLSFRSGAPLPLTLLVLLVSTMIAYLATGVIFGSIHSITLGFGASLVGASVDYALHAFSEVTETKIRDSVRTIIPGLWYGMLTSVLAFSALLATPLPGLLQIAVFAIFGLCSSFLCVALWFPYLLRYFSPPLPGPLFSAWKAAAVRAPSAARIFSLVGLVSSAILIAWGLPTIEVSDDLRQLQNVPRPIIEENGEVLRTLGISDAPRFLYLQGSSRGDLLEKEEHLRVILDSLQSEGKLQGYLAASRFIPSVTRQKENLELIQRLVMNHRRELAVQLREIGLDSSYFEQYIKKIESSSASDVILETSPVALTELLNATAITDTPSGATSLIHLYGLLDRHSIKVLEAEFPYVHFIDRLSDITALLREYRTAGILWLGAGAILVGLILIRRYGIQKGLLAVTLSLFAGGSAVSVLALCGEPFTIFSVMGLLIVFGLSVDYSIFLFEEHTKKISTGFAISLSVLTTFFSFGFLAFSEAPFLRSFGIVISVGVVQALLLSPCVLWVGTRSPRAVISALLCLAALSGCAQNTYNRSDLGNPTETIAEIQGRPPDYQMAFQIMEHTMHARPTHLELYFTVSDSIISLVGLQPLGIKRYEVIQRGKQIQTKIFEKDRAPTNPRALIEALTLSCLPTKNLLLPPRLSLEEEVTIENKCRRQLMDTKGRVFFHSLSSRCSCNQGSIDATFPNIDYSIRFAASGSIDSQN